jgi:hypothetical protein
MANFYPISPIPFQITNPDTGVLATGFTLEAYIADTTTPTPFYSDAEGTSAGVFLTVNSAGYLTNSGSVINVYLSKVVNYKFILKDALSGTEWTVNGVPALLAESALGTPAFETMQSLRASEDGSKFAQVGGNSAIGDGGHGIFYFDTTDITSADNNGTIVVDATTPRTGTWKRLVPDGRTNVAWFGVKPGDWNQTGVDAAVAWIISSNTNHLYFPSGTYNDYTFSYPSPGLNMKLYITGDGKNNTRFNQITNAVSLGDARITINISQPSDGSNGDNQDVEVSGICFTRPASFSTLNATPVFFNQANPANYNAITFKDCYFYQCDSIVQTGDSGGLDGINFIDCTFNSVATLTNKGTGFANAHNLNVTRCAGVDIGTSVRSFIQAGKGDDNVATQYASSVNVDDFKYDGDSANFNFVGGFFSSTGLTVNLSKVIAIGSTGSTNVYLANLKPFDSNARCALSIVGCGTNNTQTTGFRLRAERCNSLSVVGSRIGSLDLVNVMSTNISGCYIASSTITMDETSRAGLVITGSSHPGSSLKFPANVDYFGGNVTIAGTLTVPGNGATQVYYGLLSADKITANSKLPAGWTVASGGAGVHTVTHNLSLVDGSYSVVSSCVSDGGVNIATANRGTNAFDVVGRILNSDTFADRAVSFIMIRHP